MLLTHDLVSDNNGCVFRQLADWSTGISEFKLLVDTQGVYVYPEMAKSINQAATDILVRVATLAPSVPLALTVTSSASRKAILRNLRLATSPSVLALQAQLVALSATFGSQQVGLA